MYLTLIALWLKSSPISIPNCNLARNDKNSNKLYKLTEAFGKIHEKRHVSVVRAAATSVVAKGHQHPTVLWKYRFHVTVRVNFTFFYSFLIFDTLSFWLIVIFIFHFLKWESNLKTKSILYYNSAGEWKSLNIYITSPEHVELETPNHKPMNINDNSTDFGTCCASD